MMSIILIVRSTSNSGTSVASPIAHSRVSSKTSASFCILGHALILASEAKSTAVPRGIVIRRAGTIALLLLVVADKHDLHCRCAQEQECGDDRDGESSGVELASEAEMDGISDVTLISFAKSFPSKPSVLICWTIADRSLHIALARARTVARHDGDRDHASAEENIQDNCKECQEGNTAEAACQTDGEDEVYNSGAGNAFNGLLPVCDVDIAIRQYREELWSEISIPTVGPTQWINLRRSRFRE